MIKNGGMIWGRCSSRCYWEGWYSTQLILAKGPALPSTTWPMVNVWVTNQRPMGQSGDMSGWCTHRGWGCQDAEMRRLGLSHVWVAPAGESRERMADLTMRLGGQVTILRRGGKVRARIRWSDTKWRNGFVFKEDYWNTWWSFFARFLDTLVKKFG